MSHQIGILQGFLSSHWEDEIRLAADFNSIEWVLEQEGLTENPLMTVQGRRQLSSVLSRHKVLVHSLYATCAMQFPFWKCDGTLRNTLLSQFKNMLRFSAEMGIKTITIPLIQNGSIEDRKQEDRILREFSEIEWLLQSLGIEICFESDYPPDKLLSFVSRFSSRFGITFNTSMPDAFGRCPLKDLEIYGSRIKKVYFSDKNASRRLTALGRGVVAFPELTQELLRLGKTEFVLKPFGKNNFAAALEEKKSIEDWINSQE